MSMHLVRGMSSLNNKKRKTKNSAKLTKAKENHEAWLKKMGVGKAAPLTDKKGNRVGIYEIPDYSTGPRMTSDQIAGTGAQRKSQTYTGTEIAGIVVTHKSNLVPIRKDNKQAAVDAASMRRN